MLTDFTETNLLGALESCDDTAFAALPFGAIAMMADGTVVRYNDYESSRSGLSPANVIGKNFFHEVALCINNDKVGRRLLSEPLLDLRMPYVMTFRMKPRRVELRLLRSPAAHHMYLLLQDR